MPERNPSLEYRRRLFDSYGTFMQDAPERFDEAAARRWGKAYDYYLRGWLPGDRDAHIVDLGCGQGRLLHYLRERGYRHLIGVDINPDQVRRARQVIPDIDQANALDFLLCFRDEFDLIVAQDLIEHLTKDEALHVIERCYAALKPGGRLILQTPNADSPFAMAIRYGDPTHEICFNTNALGRLLTQFGFTAIEARELGPVPWGYSFASTGRFLVWRLVRAGLQLWNLAESGARLPVLTRVFLIKGEKGVPDD